MQRTDTIELNTIENGQPPRLRLDNADDACEIVALLSRANESRAITETAIRGTLDGNPPYNPAKLRQLAQSARANVNFREAESIHNSALSPYYDLFSEARYYAEVALDDPNPTLQVNNSKIATKEFDRMLRSYVGFDYNIQVALSDMVDFGKGFVFWGDPTNWHFTAVKQSRVMVPDATRADVDSLEILVVRQTWMVHEAWKKIMNRQAASALGWNVDEVLNEIAMANPDNEKLDNTLEIEDTQNRIRNNDLYESMRSSTIPAAHIFVREFDDKITHLIVSETFKQTRDGKSTQKKFLFKKPRRFESFRQILGTLFYDVGDGSWHSIKGLLIKMYPFIELKNRLSCSVIDNTFINLSVLVQPTTEKAFTEAVLQQQGPVSIMKNGLNVIQWGLAGRMEEGLAVEQRLENKLQANIGQYRQTVQREAGNPETAFKVKSDLFKEQALSNSSVNRLYSQLDHVYKEIWRRVVSPDLPSTKNPANQAAMAFRERCKEQGVTLEQLRKTKHVRAFRNIGNGSPFLRQQSIIETERLVPMMTDAGRQNWLDDAISVSTSHDMVDRYNPKTGAKPSDDEVIASLQAAAMIEGVEPKISDTQDHFTFATVYMEEAAKQLSAAGQPDQLPELIQFLDIVGPAVAKRISLIRPDDPRADQVKGLIKQWQQLAKITDQLKDQVSGMNEDQAMQSEQGMQMMSKEQMDAMKAAKEQERKDMTAQADIDRKNRKAQVDLQLKTLKTQAQMGLSRAQTAQKMQIEQLKALSEVGESESD